MSHELLQYIDRRDRRLFMKQLALGTAGIAGLAAAPKRAEALFGRGGRSEVTLVPGTDARQAAYDSLKPFQREIEQAIGDKQVVLKPNVGQVTKEDWLNASNADQLRGILDFLAEFYDREVIIGEGTATAGKSTFEGYENFGYTKLEKEYDCKLIDLNDEPTSVRCIQAGSLYPLPVNIINTYLDPDVYLISANRVKNSGGVLVTLSLKNVVMGSPVHHYRQKTYEGRNEKQKIHSWQGQWSRKGQTINIFMLAQMGIIPDLAVLDGTIGMEGDGPVKGTPVEHGVSLASTDWLACDRVATELMGYDWNLVKYLKWCGDAQMGEADLNNIRINGPDYPDYIVQYKHPKNYDQQVGWIYEDMNAE